MTDTHMKIFKGQEIKPCQNITFLCQDLGTTAFSEKKSPGLQVHKQPEI